MVRAHLSLRAQACSSSVAPQITKIPKGDLEAMPRVTQKQRLNQLSARALHSLRDRLTWPLGRFFEPKMFTSEVLFLSENFRYICRNKVIFDEVITRIFDPKNCNKEKKICRYYAKGLEKQEGGLSQS